ncbi:cell division protein FtsA [Natronincola peptidivorans]|uniref:Cell division protein FtsA n=1 Tax=Natronincola peptidivorans TaxID=426128 RepID=A0A1I0DJY5_9FIRM|nr:cell division FtsA domain-containing protein [Natronincola peptidivorans]SET32783.1 cell division protein FtsA [Natronincola peptidivorans]
MIFVLDIGTRSIAGLLGTLQNEKIMIHHAAIEFHSKRVMYDGQIHDIEGVVEVVKKVKAKLEEKIGFPLKEVSIAAAGRALKTYQTSLERELDELKEIDRHFISSIEIEGIQQAQKELEKHQEEATNYFCVGHTVINYYLNDGLITNPIGHKGRKFKIDILATFLPRIVIDSLYTVMEKAALEVGYLTLEPIAAIEVAVPENMRLLNIALVDIGAGTSDIAITRDGTVTAYGMTSTAGDEITEALAKTYLLDFDSAEKIKCTLCSEEEQKFTDIVGISHEVKSKDIADKIQPAIEVVAKDIAESILEQNGKSPSVVFLIGGGSQSPRLSELIADYLQLPKERVVIRSMEIIQNLQLDTAIINGPEGITPIGIMVKAIKNKQTDFIEVEVNRKTIKIFKTKRLKVSDSLVAIGFNPRDLIPKKGEKIKVHINGEEKLFFGEYGEPAKILVNGKTAHLDTMLENNDVIIINPATEGKKPNISLKDIIELNNTISVNDKTIHRYKDIKVNGHQVNPNYKLQHEDQVEYTILTNLQDLCDSLDISFQDHDIYLNGEKGNLHTKLDGIKQIIIDKKIKEEAPVLEEPGIEVIYNGEPLKINAGKKDLIFVDIFNYIDFDRTRVQGRLVIKHNGNTANYTDALKDGDEVWVYWD